MSNNRNLRLGKADRLHSRNKIKVLFASGKKIHLSGLRVLYILSRKEPGSLQMGVTAPVRQFRKAVDRNRIRRQIREAWRLQKDELYHYCRDKGWEIDLFIICTSREMPDYQSLFEQIGRIPARLIKICDEETAADT
jgi:ribonuclease P protein component